MSVSIYVASSWKNQRHGSVVEALRAAGFEAYDFMRDDGAQFHWSEAGLPNHDDCTMRDFNTALRHARAVEGLGSDRRALDACDALVLVLPCGKSAHLELGYAIGRGKLTAILCDDRMHVQAELMYGMADFISADVELLIDWLRWRQRDRDQEREDREAALGGMWP